MAIKWDSEDTSVTLVKAMVELDMLGTSSDDSGRQAVETLLVHLVQLRDMDSPTARSWVVDIFSRLANHEVLTPLTGATAEWKEIPENQRFGKYNYQNQRETSVLAQCAWVDAPVERGETEETGETDRALVGGELGEVQKLHVIEAIDVNALCLSREGVEGSTYSTWMPVVFPYMPQRYYATIDLNDSRTDQEIEEEARVSFSNQQVTVTGGRTA